MALPVVRQPIFTSTRTEGYMRRSRVVKSRVFNRVAQWFTGSQSAHEEAALRMAEMTAAIYRREVSGERTTLRQLHRIAELGQPEALTVIAALEQAGIVGIERNVGDAFESTISLSEAARSRLDRASKGKAA
ncbi:MAG: hypothetical protein ACX930_01305 [Erythrobacter sp.]